MKLKYFYKIQNTLILLILFLTISKCQIYAHGNLNNDTAIVINPKEYIIGYFKGYSQPIIDSAINYIKEGSIDDEKHLEQIIKNNGIYFYRKTLFELTQNAMKSFYKNNSSYVPRLDTVLNRLSNFKYYTKEIRDPYFDVWKLENRFPKKDTNTNSRLIPFGTWNGYELTTEINPSSYEEVAKKNISKELKQFIIKTQSIYLFLDKVNFYEVTGFIEKNYTGNERQRIIFNLIYLLKKNNPNGYSLYGYEKYGDTPCEYFEKQINKDTDLTSLDRASWLMSIALFLNPPSTDKSRLLRTAYICLESGIGYEIANSQASTRIIHKKIILLTHIGESVISLSNPYSKRLAAKYVYDFYKKNQILMDSIQQAKTIALYCRYALKFGESQLFEQKIGTVHFSISTLCNYYYPILKDSSGFWGQIARLNIISTERWFGGHSKKLTDLITSSMADMFEYNSWDKNSMDLLIRLTLLNFDKNHDNINLKSINKYYCVGDLKYNLSNRSSYSCSNITDQVFYMSEMMLNMKDAVHRISPIPLNYKYQINKHYYFDLFKKRKGVTENKKKKKPALTYQIPTKPTYFGSWISENSSDYSRLAFDLGVNHSFSKSNIERLRLLTKNKDLTETGNQLKEENKNLNATKNLLNKQLSTTKIILTQTTVELLLKEKQIIFLNDTLNKKSYQIQIKDSMIDFQEGKLTQLKSDSVTLVLKNREVTKSIEKKKAELASLNAKYFRLVILFTLVVILSIVTIFLYLLMRKRKKEVEVQKERAEASERKERLLARTVIQLGHLAPRCISSVSSIFSTVSLQYKVLDKLETLLRMFHDNFKMNHITLEQEMKMAQLFLFLRECGQSNALLKRKISFDYNFFRNLTMPIFVLFNVLVNSIEHGEISEKEKTIEVDLDQTEKQTSISVTNPKKQLEKETQKKGTGLEYIEDILIDWNGEHPFGEQYFQIGSNQQGKIKTTFTFKTLKNAHTKSSHY